MTSTEGSPPKPLTASYVNSTSIKTATQKISNSRPNAKVSINSFHTTGRGYLWNNTIGQTESWGGSISNGKYSASFSASNLGNIGSASSFKTGEKTTQAFGMTIGTDGVKFITESKVVNSSQYLKNGDVLQQVEITTHTRGANWWGVAGALFFPATIYHAVNTGSVPSPDLVYNGAF